MAKQAQNFKIWEKQSPIYQLSKWNYLKKDEKKKLHEP